MVSLVEVAPARSGFPRAAIEPSRSIRARPPRLVAEPSAEAAIGSFRQLDVSLDRSSATYWCMMRPERPCFEPSLLRDLREMQLSLGRLFGGAHASEQQLRYFVVGSHSPGIFNLGGDLSLFASFIRSGDRAALAEYARACIDVVHNNAIAYDLPVITIAMVQGDALGGGFEAALSCDIVVAERSAKFGLPEIVFNLFPGMGAYSFLSRRVGPRLAEKLIVSGRIYDARELHEMGVIDMLVEDGEAPEAVRAYIARHTRRHSAEQMIYRVRRRVNPVSYEELCDIADLWVEAALRVTEADLRKMQRIASAQSRRWTLRQPAHSMAMQRA